MTSRQTKKDERRTSSFRPCIPGSQPDLARTRKERSWARRILGFRCIVVERDGLTLWIVLVLGFVVDEDGMNEGMSR
jgi:hypothetical protein